MTLARLRWIHGVLPAPLRSAIPHRLEIWGRALAAAQGGPGSVAGLEARLWGGFGRAARRDLEALAAGADPATAAEAALVLARAAAAEGDFAGALDWLTRHPAPRPERRRLLLEALFLSRIGRGPEARARLAALPRTLGFDVSRALVEAGSWRPAAGEEGPRADARTLERINAIFRRFGLQPVTRHDPDAPIGLDNLAGVDPGPKPGTGPRVSVIVPAWNAEATLAAALRGLAQQTWGDLEVLVVDDASSDGTAAVAKAFAAVDSRFRLIRQPTNVGGYAARNRALALATGDLITVHDADDWSHPEKIAAQVRALLRSGADSSFSDWVRTTPDLGFLGPARVFPDLVGLNDSSGLFRRALFERFGSWDEARIAADKELIWRFELLAGRRREAFRRRTVLPGCPLSFGRLIASSLTRSGPTHVLTIYHGLRREYREAAAHWQDGLDRAAVARAGWRRGLGQAPWFPAPPVLRGAPSAPADLLFVGDFNFRGGTQKSARAMLAAARAAGRSAALLHYRRYDQDVTAPLAAEVRAEAAALGVRILAPGEELAASTVVVTYPPVLAEVMDRFPRVAHDRLVVVVNQLAARDRSERDVAYDPLRVRAHLAELFGGESLWIPISERVRAAMAADPRYPAPHPDIWTPLIDADAWGPPPAWRGAGRLRPVIGRHGRDHPLKWPGERQALLDAYCAGRDCEVRFLGGAGFARAVAGGRWPSNWRVAPFGDEVRGFLAGLDVFLHFPHADYIEEFGRAPLEAMAAGVPVILPPEFAPTFGAAALYAAPAEVWEFVSALWRDRGFWEARAVAGRAFAASCGYDAFPARLARLL